jgi:hypothetical protein
MKISKHSLDHIELISSGETALFEIRLIVAMEDFCDETDDMGALDWLMNLLSLASQGEDIKTGADAFIRAMLTLNEERVHLCRVEKIVS